LTTSFNTTDDASPYKRLDCWTLRIEEGNPGSVETATSFHAENHYLDQSDGRPLANELVDSGMHRLAPPAVTIPIQNGSATSSFVIPRVCNFIGFAKKLMLKTNSLGASKIATNQ
jgi:hypothetical protein